ncbi:MAG: sigma-54-dependent Fis family transcriptional regulator [Kiritimatiellae bacterium]|nr:sigma-54-dependent Fis family transcriptional regulator [Kiritimatiellia bacterium]
MIYAIFDSDMAKMIIVDDESALLQVLDTLLKAEGHQVITFDNPENARDMLSSDEEHDLMLCDIRMVPINGMQLLRLAREKHPDMSVVMLTAFGSVETAIQAMKLGAFDYVPKPFKVDELLITIQRALEYKKAISENINLRAQLETQYQFENIVAESDSMQKVCEIIKRIAPTNSSVLISGESGTGKELVARAIHTSSTRKGSTFMAINCAALPEPLLESEMFGHVKGAFTGADTNKKGLFESANGGTLFFDEISSMSAGIQSKLLRVLQEKEVRPVGGNKNIPVDVRILAATNTPLEGLMEHGKFREDLFYRINVIHVDIPPLRKRKEDILPLAYHIITHEIDAAQTPPKIDKETCSILEAYAWPGNVRELENCIKHALTFMTDNIITKDILPTKIAETTVTEPQAILKNIEAERCRSLRVFLQVKEREYMEAVLKNTNGDKEKAAGVLKISLATLYRKLPDSENE